MLVLPFNQNTLAEALQNKWTSPETIKSKYQYKYLNNYLSNEGIDAKTIVIEEEYVSKDFLHDFATYYSLCFQNYPKFCKRVHFFSSEFDQSELNNRIVDSTQTNFWDSYLGFIVVRPIPLTTIGYTILKTYDAHHHEGRRIYWGLREYKVHLFGRVLKLNSLAFQEQDSVLAACATASIWTMLNKASIDYSTTLKVPSEITRDAAKLQNDGSRLFPNKGLDTIQICQAINNSGLAPEVRTGNFAVKDKLNDDGLIVQSHLIKKMVNAYHPIGIPIILGIKVPVNSIYGSSYGYHAIAVLGHKVLPNDDPACQNSPFIADRITKLYLHDDQHGPFARVKFLEDDGLETPWTDENSDNWPTQVISMVIPVYPKIRISYEDIESIIIAFDQIITRAFKGGFKKNRFWDIKINYSEVFKEEIIRSSLDDTDKIRLVDSNMPKYLWIATFYIGENKVYEFVFDATDVRNAMIGRHVVSHAAEEFNQRLKDYISENKTDIQEFFISQGSMEYLDFILNQL